MRQRVITAVVALALFLPILYLGGLSFQLLVAALAVVGVYELFKMKGLEIKTFEGLLAVLGAIILVLPQETWFFFLPNKANNYILFYVTMMLLLSAAVFSRNTYTLDDAAFPILVSLYLGFGFQSFVLAREAGLIVVVYGLLVVWSTDIGAYMIGRQWGKTKLAPAISPNKTIEGSLGGILSAVVVSGIYWLIFSAQKYLTIKYGWVILFTVFFSAVGQLGDLVESAYKRHYGVKDSGNLLPGHGGILDRFDSLLFVMPVMHLFGLF